MNIGKVQTVEITEEVQKSYLNYAMSVIVQRALPDVRDGLKPVHRRILFAMHAMGLTPSSAYTKSAKIVGETMGKYHPHGDGPIYDSLVRLAQDFSMRYPLIDGQGNYGSVDGDPPAAMRYCVTGDTLVVTNKGLQEIQEISQKEDINTKIISLNNTINSASKWFDSGKHQTIKIKTKQGFKIQGSLNHPILVWAVNELSGKPGFKWKFLEEVKIGDVTVIDRTPDILWPKHKLSLKSFIPTNIAPRTEMKILPQTLTEDLAFILGSLVSEGSVAKNKIEFCNTDIHWVSAFEQKWKNTFPDCRLHKFLKHPSSYGKKDYYRLEIHSLYIVEFMRNLGLMQVRAAEKTIPTTILKSPKFIVASFLQAYFEGDGSINRSSKMIELSAIAKSKKIIEQLQILLLRFGIASTHRFDSHRGTQKLYIRGGKNYRLFKNEIGFLSYRKTQKLEEIIKSLIKDQSLMDYVPFLKDYIYSNLAGNYEQRRFLVKHNFDRYTNLAQNQIAVVDTVTPTIKDEARQLIKQVLLNNYLFDSIDAIEDGGIQNVYSLKVESKCHSFVANGFINHNTEARPAKISLELLADIEKDTVDTVENFDGTLKEPEFLPSVLPNLLLMGSEGIAVGMATKIPPHNLGEVVDAIMAVIEKGKAIEVNSSQESVASSQEGKEKKQVADEDFFIKKIDLAVAEGLQKAIEVTPPKIDFESEITTEELMQFVKGPDFPTGGLIYGGKYLPEIYGTGRGSILVRGVAKIEEAERGKSRIVVTELPYQVNKAMLVAKIAELVRDKKMIGISDLRDESDHKGMSVVIELKKDARPKSVLNNLYKHTQLQTTFPANFVAIVDGTPRTLALKQILTEYVKHRQKVVIRRSIYDLTEAKKRAHILEGLKIALDHLDEVIKTIRASRDAETAKLSLMEKFSLTEIQSIAILDMQLRRLSALERDKIEEEYKKIAELIAYLTDLLTHPNKILGVIKDELKVVKDKYQDARRTKVYAQPVGEITESDLIAKEEVIITITRTGYIKRVPPSTYRSQARGGKGVMGMVTKGEDEIEHIVSASTHDQLMIFTDRGRVFAIRVWEINEGSRTSKGQAIVNLINIDQGETIQAVLPMETQDAKNLVMATLNGTVKKTTLTQFKNLRSSGLIAIKLDKGDSLVWVRPTTGEEHVLLATRAGKSIRFKEADVRATGRDTQGVRGITLKAGDKVIGMEVFPEKEKVVTDKRLKTFRDILVVTTKGQGKRTPVSQFPVQKRGGSGVKIAELSDKNGELEAALMVTQDVEQIIMTSKHGIVIRLPIKNIPQLGRATQGVILMRPDKTKGDTVAAVALLDKEESMIVENSPEVVTE